MTYVDKKIADKKAYDARTSENRKRIEVSRKVLLLASKFAGLDKR